MIFSGGCVGGTSRYSLPGSWTFNAYANFLHDTVAFCKQNPRLLLSYEITSTYDPYILGESWLDIIDPDPTYSRGIWNFVKLGMLASIAFDPKGTFVQSIKAITGIWDDPFVQQAEAYGRAFADRGIFTGVKNLTFYQGNPQLTRMHHGLGDIRSTALVGGGDVSVLRGLSTEVWAAHATNWLRNGIRPS